MVDLNSGAFSWGHLLASKDLAVDTEEVDETEVEHPEDELLLPEVELEEDEDNEEGFLERSERLLIVLRTLPSLAVKMRNMRNPWREVESVKRY